MTRPDALAFPRHSFVGLRADWSRHLRAAPAPEDFARLDDWTARGRPLVVARRVPEDGADDVRLGLALPDKTRIAVHVGAAAVASVTPPPGLDDAIAAAPAAWAPRLEKILAAARAEAAGVRVFGSLAWQFLTGLGYLRPDSDVDLLVRAGDWPALERLAARLDALDGCPPRLDGEAVLPDGGGVSWRELARRPSRLLVKAAAGVSLRPYAEVRACFGEVVA